MSTSDEQMQTLVHRTAVIISCSRLCVYRQRPKNDRNVTRGWSFHGQLLVLFKASCTRNDVPFQECFFFHYVWFIMALMLSYFVSS